MGCFLRATVASVVVNLKNDAYFVTLRFRSGKVEHYWKGADRWHKTSFRGRRFDATAEQVLNHLLPALADVKKGGIVVEVLHVEDPRDRPIPRAGRRSSRDERAGKVRPRAPPRGHGRRGGHRAHGPHRAASRSRKKGRGEA
jgi:hypothetical protein